MPEESSLIIVKIFKITNQATALEVAVVMLI